MMTNHSCRRLVMGKIYTKRLVGTSHYIINLPIIHLYNELGLPIEAIAMCTLLYISLLFACGVFISTKGIDIILFVCIVGE